MCGIRGFGLNFFSPSSLVSWGLSPSIIKHLSQEKYPKERKAWLPPALKSSSRKIGRFSCWKRCSGAFWFPKSSLVFMADMCFSFPRHILPDETWGLSFSWKIRCCCWGVSDGRLWDSLSRAYSCGKTLSTFFFFSYSWRGVLKPEYWRVFSLGRLHQKLFQRFLSLHIGEKMKWI